MNIDTHRAKYPLSNQKQYKTSLVDKADDMVDIRDILRDMKIWTPDGTFYSYKISCPWDYEHSDGGLDKNCRIFGSNNIYCWAMHGRITSTSLYARWKGLPRKKAAVELLQDRGLLYKPWKETWNELIEDRQNIDLGSKDDIVAALHEILAIDSGYNKHEFSSPVRAQWVVVLKALDAVWRLSELSIEDLNLFFTRSLKSLQNSVTAAENIRNSNAN